MSLHEQHMNLVHQPAEYNHFDGLRILVPSEVYHPHEGSSTRLILQAIPNVHDLNVLEIGSGSGALALWIKQRGAKNVVATDISEKACAAMECNAMVNNLKIDVRQGDLFCAVHPGERFDLVIFNLPLLNKPVQHLSEIALCDPNGELLKRFLAGLQEIVTPGGIALFTHASISAPLPIRFHGHLCTEAESLRGNGETFRVLSWRQQ